MRSAWPIVLVLLAGLSGWPVRADEPAAPGQAADPQARIDQTLTQAASCTDPATREKLLAQASGELEGLLGSLAQAKDADDTATLRRLALELKLAETDGLLRAAPYATRLLYLQGRREDRQTLAELTDKAARRMDSLVRQIDSRLTVWQGDYRRMVTVAPGLEDLRQTASYKAAWIELYRGLALEGEQARAAFQRAAELAHPFATGPEGSGVKYWSLLVCGIAWRQCGRYDQAATCLQPAAATADAVIRLEALYQLARNRIECAATGSRRAGATSQPAQEAGQEFTRAQKDIEAFAQAAGQAPQGRDRLDDEVKAVLLTHYLHQAMAEAAGEGQARRVHRRQAQEALGQLAMKHRLDELGDDYLRIVAEKYRGATDHDELNSLVLLALAAGMENGGADGAKAAGLLEKVLWRGDELSVAVRPLAVWHLATIKAKGTDKLAAARLFRDLAAASTDSPLARPSAVNAAVCYNGVLADATDRAVEPELREEFVAALGLLLGRWGSQEPAWYFDLGWQCEKLSEGRTGQEAQQLLAKAQAAYESVPPSCEHHMHARWRALEVRCKRLASGPQAQEGGQQAAEGLAGELLAYTGQVRALMQTAGQSQQAELAEWGALAEFEAARLLANVPGRENEAARLLEEMPQRWPSSPALVEATWMLARDSADRGQADQALAAVQRLAAYDQQEAIRLCRDLIERLRARSSADGQAPGESGPRRRYLPLAEYLYSHRDQLDGQEATYAKVAYAEALLVAGKADAALELLLACQQEAQQAAAAQREKIESALAQRLAAAGEAGGDLAKLRPLAAQLLAELGQVGLKVEQSRSGWAVKQILADLDGAVTAEQESRLLGRLAQALCQGYREVAQAKARSLPARGDVLALLARAYQDLGQFDQAAQLYKKLAEGLEGGGEVAAYWQAELGYCRCLLKSRGGDNSAMRSLAVRIAQLRQQDATMGGLAERFAQVEAQADTPAR